MKTIRLLLLILYACAALAAGLWTVTAIERFAHAVHAVQSRT